VSLNGKHPEFVWRLYSRVQTLLWQFLN